MMQAKQMPEKTNVLEIPDNVEVFYPEEKRAVLAKCLELNGFLGLCAKNTGVRENTIKKYATPDSKGQKSKVEEVMKFVDLFNQNTAA